MTRCPVANAYKPDAIYELRVAAVIPFTPTANCTPGVVFGVHPGMAGESATMTALPYYSFTTAVTVRQADSTMVACAVADANTLVTTIHLINARIEFLLGIVSSKSGAPSLSSLDPLLMVQDLRFVEVQCLRYTTH